MPPGLSPDDFYYVLPEIVLTLGSMLVLMADLVVPRERHGVLIGISVGVLAATVGAIAIIGSPHITVSGGLMSIDAFGTYFKLLFIGAAALTLLMSGSYLEVENTPAGPYCFLVLAATLGMMFMAAGVELVTIFIGLETMAVSFYILAGYLKPNARSNEAAVKYFLLGAFSLGILLYGMSILYGLTGTTNLRAIDTALVAQLAANEQTGGNDLMLLLAVVLILAGIGFKIAAVPFHMWAPDVYEGAPTPITAFLSVGSKAASFAMLLRIFVEGLPSMSVDWRVLFEALAILTMTVGNIAAITQTNIKRMLAYSSIAQAGYVLIGVVAGTERGIAATLIYLLVYAFMQLGAFAVIVMLRRRDAIGDELKDFNGLYFRSPLAAFAMLLFMLSLGGIPPTAGFMGKLWLFSAAIEAGYVRLAVIGVLNSAVSLYYYIRVVVYMWLKNEPVGSEPRLSPALAVTIAIALVATLAFGVFPKPMFDVAQTSASALLGAAGLAAER
jgi:NADH-quinone oxidoreductase subunit N